MLSIYEALFLLALDEEKGNIIPLAKHNLTYGLAGAVLAELALQGKVTASGKRRLEAAADAAGAPTGGEQSASELLEETLQAIRSNEKPRKLGYWISYLSSQPRKLRERIAEPLVARSLLHQDDKAYYRVTGDGQPGKPVEALPTRFEMKHTLRSMVLSTGESNLHSLALLDIIKACSLLNLVFTQDELPGARQMIQEKVMRTALTTQVMLTVEEINQAVDLTLEEETE
jgi:hypothetical protein